MEQLFEQLVDAGLEDLGLEDDDDLPTEEYGHPDHSPLEVLENLRSGFKYHKNGPAREYDWTKEDRQIMTDLIRERAAQVEKRRKKERVIRGQDYLGNSEKDHLVRWVNACLVGIRFPNNPKVRRGAAIGRKEWSNKKLWRYVSETLIAEFDYWNEMHVRNQKGPPEAAQYPKVSDLIFRHNDDFTSGLWSEFSDFWEPFLNDMRLD